MPFKPGVVISVRGERLELTSELVDPRGDTPEAFAPALDEVLLEHRYRLLSDPGLLEPGFGASSFVSSRSPLAAPLEAVLAGRALTAAPTATRAAEPSIFGRLRGARHAQLHRFGRAYARPAELDPALGRLEAAAIDGAPSAPLPAASEAWVEHGRRVGRGFGLRARDGAGWLAELEDRWLSTVPTGAAPIWGPELATLVAAQIYVALAGHAEVRFADEDSATLLFARDDAWIETDPVLRVARFLRDRDAARLSAYVAALTRGGE